jgi:DNA replication ATP-dependent helicase Dna2
VQLDRSSLIKTIHLRGDWVDTPANAKSFVHVLGEFQSSGRCVIDNTQNILILHPDQLISATVIADSFTCMRRAVLQDRVKATSDKTPPLVYGTLLHEIFQEALMANRWNLEFLDEVISGITEKHVEDLYTIKTSIEEAREHLRSKMPELRSWATAFVAPYPRVWISSNPHFVHLKLTSEFSPMLLSRAATATKQTWRSLSSSMSRSMSGHRCTE